MLSPYCFVHWSRNGKIIEEQLWVVGCSPCCAFESKDCVFCRAPTFPSKKEGRGPLIPCFLSFDLSLSGFNITTSHIFMNMLMKPSNATAIMILKKSNGNSMALCLYHKWLLLLVPLVYAEKYVGGMWISWLFSRCQKKNNKRDKLRKCLSLAAVTAGNIPCWMWPLAAIEWWRFFSYHE